MPAQYDQSLYNEDLAPVPVEKRTWGIYNYASLWVAMSVCIPTYMLASGLIAGGMSWKQAIGTILLGNLIVLVPDAFERACWRQIWYSLSRFCSRLVWRPRRECAGGAPRHCGLRMVRHSSVDRRPGNLFDVEHLCPGHRRTTRSGHWLCFFAFWLLNMAVIWRGIETIKFLEGIGAPFMLGIGLLLLWWITRKGWRPGTSAQQPEQVRQHPRVLALLCSQPDRHGWLLGDRCAQHSRLHALCTIPKGAGSSDRRWGCRRP